MSESPTVPETDWSKVPAWSDDEYHRLLSSDRRRRLLDVLTEQPESVDLATVAEALAEREAATTGGAFETVEQVSITLHHRHLPHLDEVGMVEYDPETKTVSVHHERLFA